MFNVGINGFGRIGRLVTRILLENKNVNLVAINDPAGNSETHAHLLMFDSVHGKCSHDIRYGADHIIVDDKKIACFANTTIADTDWRRCDIVIECSGVMKSKSKLQAYLDQGVKRVLVSAPIDEPEVQNLVMGVNHTHYDKDTFQLITAASCTTNCLAPVIKVLQEKIGIVHGSMTTIHDITNTQTILDSPHKDLRRARASGMSLIPTTTGSAKAITKIFPELIGKLNGHAVRVPLANASLTDCVFEMQRTVSVDEINTMLEHAALNELKGILGYESRPLVSIDYRTDPRSCIVDGLSTMVVNGTQLKLYLWYDNEWGYANRTAELAMYIAQQDQLC